MSRPLGRNDLVLCAGTLLTGSLIDLIDAAVAGRFDAITLFPQHLHRARAAGDSDADIRRRIADAGLVVADLDPFLCWLPGDVPEALIGQANGDFYVAPEHEFLEIASGIGGRSINIAQGFNASIDRAAAAEAIASLCERTSAHGLLVTLEFLPWSGIPDLSAALAIVEASGRSDATVMLDTWHWYRGGADREALRGMAGARIGSVQLNDTSGPAWDDVMSESTQARALPGTGEIPLVEIVRQLDAAGCDAPIGVEVFSSELLAKPPKEIGTRCGDAARRVLEEARSPV